MANFRAMGFRLNDKKIAELEQVSVKFMTNGEQMVGTDEVLGESVGIITTEASWDIVVPVEGTQINMNAILLAQSPVSLSYEDGGQIFVIPGKLIDGERTSTMKSGVTKGKYSFRGGKPKVAA